jgi:hypothetical protein
MYYGEMDDYFLSLAVKLGLHPSTLAPLSSFSIIILNRYLFDQCMAIRTIP